MMLIFFFALTVGWLALPFLPALVELTRRRDAEPLRVVAASEVDIRHFARGFRQHVDARFADALAAAATSGQERVLSSDDDERVRVLPPSARPGLEAGVDPAGYTRSVLLGAGDLELEPRVSYLGEIVARGDLRGGEGVILRAGLALRDIELATGSVSLRWLHADGEVRIAADCAAYGRVSADGAMRLGVGSTFERLNAPRVLAAEHEQPPPAPAGREPRGLRPEDLPGFIELDGGRVLVNGDLELPPHSRLAENLVVTGELILGEGAELHGNVKARRDLRLAAGAKVTGAAVSGQGIIAGPHCRIGGPLIAEGDLTLGSCCRVGETDRPTTLSAEHIQLRPGCVVHGSVRARRWGTMLPPADDAGEEEVRDA